MSPDGTRLIFHEITATGAGTDLMQLDLDDVPASRVSAGGQPVGARRVTPLVQTPFAERNGIVSPDGRWLAYEANDSGQFEIYVRPYPGGEQRLLAGVDGRREQASLGAQQSGAVLSVADRSTDAGRRRSRPRVGSGRRRPSLSTRATLPSQVAI